MRNVPRVALLASLLGLLFGLAGPVRAGELPTVAVVDFVSTNGPVDSVMLGAADLLEVELGRYDVRVISRRELNLLRVERGLARSGVVRLENFQGGALPWADFLLRGEYQHNPGGSSVRFRLVDAKTGTERGSWQLLVARPADLVKNLDPILSKIAAAVCGGKVASPRPRNQPGFTTIPEAASTFYHGLEHIISGRAEYAAEYFRIAAASDPGFSLAVLGQAKAYDQLGFSGVAKAVRATIPADLMPPARATGTSSVLTVRFVNRSDVFTPGQIQRIRAALQETHGFALFEPDWIPALTKETDLKLSADFPLVHGLDHRLWLRADHFIVFSAEKKGLRASVIDLLHGRLLGTVSGGATNLDALCAQAVAVIRLPGAAVADMPPAQTRDTNGPAVKLNFTYSVAEVACAMRRLADQPKDLACWIHLLCVMQPERLPPDVFRAFLDAHEAAIPQDAPDAVDWLASVLWARYFLDTQAAPDLPDIEKSFAPLLQRYPNSLQAQVVRFHIARFLFARGELERSRKLAVEVADKTAPQVLAMDSFIPLQGQYLDCIKQVDYAAFPNVIPPQGPRMTMLARDIFALAASLSALAGDTTNAQIYLAKAAPLEQLTLVGPPRSHHFGGPVSIYPMTIGVWQTGHIGYDWNPADPADNGRVQVGWTFLPYAMSRDKPTIAATASTYAMLHMTREKLKTTVAAALPAGPKQGVAKPRNLEAEVVAEYMRQNPKTGASDRRPPREIWQEWLNLRSTDRGPYGGERDYDTALNVFFYTCTKEGKERGAAAAADFAVQALADFRGAGARVAAEFGEIRAGKLALRMYVGATHYCMEAADPIRAWTLTQQALAWRGRDDLKFSLRYQAALAAWKAGHGETAAGVLRSLAEDPRAKDLQLILPFVTESRRSVYLESVDLLEKVRAGSAPDCRPAAIDLTPLKPYYMGGIRPGTTKKEKPKRSTKKPTKEEEWAQIMSLWHKSHEQKPLLDQQDVMPESYEAWPEIADHLPPKTPPPRFGQPYVCMLEDEVGMDFVWIASMRMWAAKYELTEDAFCYAMTERETGGNLPQQLSYEQSMAVCATLNERERGRLPEGYCYRIPTVEEWERLARCGTDRIYPWGSTMPPTFGNYCDEAVREGIRKRIGERYEMYVPPFIAGYNDGYEERAPVEASGKNEWGLYGMGGNLWEWATTPTGDMMAKGASWLLTGDMLRVDAGLPRANNCTLRVVLAPERKPATPLP